MRRMRAAGYAFTESVAQSARPMTETLASTRGDLPRREPRLHGLRGNFFDATAALPRKRSRTMGTPGGFFRNRRSNAPKHRAAGGPLDAPSTRSSRLTIVVYVLLALAAPVFVHWGPDVLSPTAAAIANAALDGRLVPPHPLCAAAKTFTARRAPAAGGC
jgi:hypothetical protein